jgi:hypothetical protein
MMRSWLSACLRAVLLGSALATELEYQMLSPAWVCSSMEALKFGPSPPRMPPEIAIFFGS